MRFYWQAATSAFPFKEASGQQGKVEEAGLKISNPSHEHMNCYVVVSAVADRTKSSIRFSSTAYTLQASFHARTSRDKDFGPTLADCHLRRHGIQLGRGLELARVRPGFGEHGRARAPRCWTQLPHLCEVPSFSAPSQVMALCPYFASSAPRGSRPRLYQLHLRLACCPPLSS